MFQQYLILFAEIRRNKKAKISIEGEEILIEQPKDGVWVLKNSLLTFEKKIPSKIAECLFTCGLISLQSQGPTLEIEDKKIILSQAQRAPSGFIEFKNRMNNFINASKEWRETLRELSRQSPSSFYEQKLLFAY